MKLVAQPAFVGARGFDTVATLTPTTAAWAKSAGFDFVLRYLGSLSPAELAAIVGAGLAVMPVCYADRFDGVAALAELAKLAMPAGVTTWADVEAVQGPSPALIGALNTWAVKLRSGGFDPGAYFGAGQQLTSVEMGHLVLDRYWQAASKITDRFGSLAEPTLETGPIGWCMKQGCPGNLWTWKGKPTPFQIDVDFIYEDFRARVPTWCVGLPAATTDAPTLPELPDAGA